MLINVRSTTGFLVATATILLTTAPSIAVEECRARIDRRTGQILAYGRGVIGDARWAITSDGESFPFANAEDCVNQAEGRLARCTLAEPSSPAAITPPEGCILYMADDGPKTCAAYVRYCVPGLRDSGPLLTRIAELEEKLASMSLEDEGATVRFTGVNVQVVSGTGYTHGPNGLGNLVVGYNANVRGAPRNGSHNIVVGDEHGYSSYGGLVAGHENTISGFFSTVSGGQKNIASGPYASVSGGFLNEASEQAASVSGGAENIASGSVSSISGGDQNQATTYLAAVSGGRRNVASGDIASVLGGFENVASGPLASVLGGFRNEASGSQAAALGGTLNEAGGDRSAVSGGSANVASGFNSAVNGGARNVASASEATVGGGRDRSAEAEGNWTAGSLTELD